MKGIELLVYRCEKCVEIKGDYVGKWQSCFISVTLKSWSGRKLLDPTTYSPTIKIAQQFQPLGVPFTVIFPRAGRKISPQ